MPTNPQVADVLERLATRVDDFDKKLQSIIDNQGARLSVSGQATALGMLLVLNLPLFAEVVAALRQAASQSRESGNV